MWWSLAVVGTDVHKFDEMSQPHSTFSLYVCKTVIWPFSHDIVLITMSYDLKALSLVPPRVWLISGNVELWDGGRGLMTERVKYKCIPFVSSCLLMTIVLIVLHTFMMDKCKMLHQNCWPQISFHCNLAIYFTLIMYSMKFNNEWADINHSEKALKCIGNITCKGKKWKWLWNFIESMWFNGVKV